MKFLTLCVAFFVVPLAFGTGGADDEGNPLTANTTVGRIDGAVTTIGDLGDIIIGSNTNEVEGAVSTNALHGTVYDFSTNRGIIKAVADMVAALGGTITNNPVAN